MVIRKELVESCIFNKNIWLNSISAEFLSSRFWMYSIKVEQWTMYLLYIYEIDEMTRLNFNEQLVQS